MMQNQASLFTNNQWKPGSGEPFVSLNPANHEIVWQGRSCLLPEINEAVQNAQEASQDWSALSADERTLYLDAFRNVLKERRHELAKIISKENGKPLWESMNEVQSMIDKVALSLEAYGLRCAGIIHDNPNARSITRHRPHGAVAIFGPFNFPGHLPNGHIIPAFLAGNTVIFKPSEFTPLTGETIANYWLEAGLPKGVLNVVQGGKETGQALMQHPDIRGAFFTGSYETGRIFSEYFGKHPEKILALEMGGNNPLIINEIDEINIPAAAYFTIQSAYLTAGQRCTCARRLLLVRNQTNEAYVQHLIELVKRISVGSYSDQPEPFMGPVVSENQALKLLQVQEKLKQMGGKSLIAMQHLKAGTGLISPGLMDSTGIATRPDEEYFGPFLQLIWVKNLDEAIAEANRTKFGLTAGLFTKNKQEYDYFYKRIQAGIVNWNTPLTGSSSAAPFGGIKCSGNHRPSAYYAADFCSYPVASMEASHLKMPNAILPGIKEENGS